MTACWCRLTQPEKRRRKKESGGGSGSMAEACPRRRSGSRGASLGYRRPPDRAEVPEAQASSEGVDTPIFRKSVLGRVFAPDGMLRTDRADIAAVLDITRQPCARTA